MPSFSISGLKIAYTVAGSGPAVLCIHGFASSAKVNWLDTGWIESLVEAGYTAIAIDNRGHGESDKPHDPEAYHPRSMASDALALLDHLKIEKAAVLGYSMGARIAAFLAYDHPDRLSCAVFGGMGMNLVHGLSDSSEIIAGLSAPSLDGLTHPIARQFRIFADHTRSDRLALAACMETSREPMAQADVRRIGIPVLVAVGSEDTMAGRPEALAELLPKGEAFVIERRDHMRATGDREFKRATIAFLAAHHPQ